MAYRLAWLSPTASLFAYGSLRFPEVVETLIGRMPDHTPAVAQGWRAAALPQRVYPALVTARASAPGILFKELTAAEWRVFDAFEDEVYELRELSLADNRTGWAYVCTDESEVLPGDWDVEHFRDQELATYALRCGSWRQRWEARQ